MKVLPALIPLVLLLQACAENPFAPPRLIERTLVREAGEWVEERFNLPAPVYIPAVSSPITLPQREGIQSQGHGSSTGGTADVILPSRSLLITANVHQPLLIEAVNQSVERILEDTTLSRITVLHSLARVTGLPLHDVWFDIQCTAWNEPSAENGENLTARIETTLTNRYRAYSSHSKATFPVSTYSSNPKWVLNIPPDWNDDLLERLTELFAGFAPDGRLLMNRPQTYPDYDWFEFQPPANDAPPLPMLEDMPLVMEGRNPLSAAVRVWSITDGYNSREVYNVIRDRLDEENWSSWGSSGSPRFETADFYRESELVTVTRINRPNFPVNQAAPFYTYEPVLVTHFIGPPEEEVISRLREGMDEGISPLVVQHLERYWYQNEPLLAEVLNYFDRTDPLFRPIQSRLAEHWKRAGNTEKQWHALKRALEAIVINDEWGLIRVEEDILELRESHPEVANQSLTELYESFGVVLVPETLEDEYVFSIRKETDAVRVMHTRDGRLRMLITLNLNPDTIPIGDEFRSYYRYKCMYTRMRDESLSVSRMSSSSSDYSAGCSVSEERDNTTFSTSYGLEKTDETEEELIFTLSWEVTER